jgi:transposase, IS5 family
MRNPSQIEMISLDRLVPKNHAYRKIKDLVNFSKMLRELKDIEKEEGAKGYGIDRLFFCLLLQFMEDLSDREMERFIQENTSAKWFCGFGLTEKTPKYSLFCRVRTRIGCNRISKIFDEVRSQLKARGYMNEVFTVVDATALISKFNLWEERDKSIKEGYDKLNNTNISKYSADKDAKIGAKSTNKFWYGYKKHSSIDTQSGMINKVAVTPANITDADGMQHVCPKSGMVIADKGYVGAINTILYKGAHPAVILRNNMKDKIREKDKWLTAIRSPYERMFSKQTKRVRYRGIAKNQFSEFMYAMSFNFRRLLVLEQ